MPFYEYHCDDCGHEFEAMQKISDEPLKDCPACKKPSLRKKISAAGFRLKGGGWYETDFKLGKKKNIASADSKSDSSSKTEKKTSDTKKVTESKSSNSAGSTSK